MDGIFTILMNIILQILVLRDIIFPQIKDCHVMQDSNLLVLFQATNSIVTLFPVIMLYQIYAYSVPWMTVWFFWWIIPFLLLASLFYCITKYIHFLKYPHKYKFATAGYDPSEDSIESPLLHDPKAMQARPQIPLNATSDYDIDDGHTILDCEKIPWNIKKYKRMIIANLLTYIAVMLINFGVTYWIENEINNSGGLVEGRYIICNAFVTFITTCIFTFVYLDLQFGREHTATKLQQEEFTEDGQDDDEDENVKRSLNYTIQKQCKLHLKYHHQKI